MEHATTGPDSGAPATATDPGPRHPEPGWTDGTGDPGGAGDPEWPPVRTRASVPSPRLALIVVGIAAGLLVLFGVGAALTGTSTPPASSKSPPAAVKGTTLRAMGAMGATAALHPIERPGTPPADVLQAVVVPAGSATVSSKPWDGATQFSGTVTFRLPTSQETVVAFFRAELKARGWSMSSVGPAEGKKNAIEVLAQRASTDGWYWEIGVVVSPTTFGAGGSGAAGTSGAAGADTTRFSLNLFEEPDTG